MQPILMIVPSAALLSGIGILLLALRIFRTRHVVKPRRPPVPENVLPEPGQSTLARIDHLDREIAVLTVAAFVLPILVCAAVLVPIGTGRAEFNLFSVGIAGAMGLGAYAYSLNRLVRLMAQRREARIEYDGKTAVGQALSRLAKDGYRVFHEVPADEFTIDHVVVGRPGVFAVEVKTRAKPRSGGSVEDATVAYNGHVLFFRRTTDEETIARSQRKADWLSEWLGAAFGEEVAARAVVAVPGWFVKRTTPEGIPVVNPRQIPSLFKFIVPRPLDADQVVRIASELERRCRPRQTPQAEPAGELLTPEAVAASPEG